MRFGGSRGTILQSAILCIPIHFRREPAVDVTDQQDPSATGVDDGVFLYGL